MSPLIGVLGGTFNPAHYGHLYISFWAKHFLRLDKVMWLVARHNPFKSAKPSFEKRFRALEKTPLPLWIEISDFEQKYQLNHSFDSLSLLKKLYPHKHFVFLMGADNFCQLHDWHRGYDIAQLLPIAVAPRKNHPMRTCPMKARLARYVLSDQLLARLATSHPPQIGFLPILPCPISSTQIRQSAR